MSNFFDQFDRPSTAPSPGNATLDAGNFFDQFDATPAPSDGNFFDQFDTPSVPSYGNVFDQFASQDQLPKLTPELADQLGIRQYRDHLDETEVRRAELANPPKVDVEKPGTQSDWADGGKFFMQNVADGAATMAQGMYTQASELTQRASGARTLNVGEIAERQKLDLELRQLQEDAGRPDDLMAAQVSGATPDDMRKMVAQRIADSTAKIKAVEQKIRDFDANTKSRASDTAKAIAQGYDKIAGDLAAQRKLYKTYYNVDQEYQESFLGQLVGAAGQVVPQVGVGVLPGVGLAALQSQAFQASMDDAKETAERTGKPYDPELAYAYAMSNSFQQMLLEKTGIEIAIGRLFKAGNKAGLGASVRRVAARSTGGGSTEVIQGAAQDHLATMQGIEERNPFDPKRRLTEFGIGMLLDVPLSTSAEVADRLHQKAAPATLPAPKYNPENKGQFKSFDVLPPQAPTVTTQQPSTETANTSPMPQAPNVASDPTVITPKMEADLRASGKTPAEINAMTPEEAWDFLNPELGTPPPESKIASTLERVDDDVELERETASELAGPETDQFRGVLAEDPLSESDTQFASLTREQQLQEQAEENAADPIVLEKIKKATMPRTANSILEAKAAAIDFLDEDLVNNATGLHGKVSKASLKKMLSNSALSKSISGKAHTQAVANVDQLFQNAEFVETHPDRGEDPNFKAIHRLWAPMIFGNEVLAAKITLKELADSNQNNRIYSVEAIDVEKVKPAGQSVDASAQGQGLHTPITGFIESVGQLTTDVKREGLRAKIKKTTGEAGFIDTAIFGEIVDYGRQVFRQGMDFLDWAVRMVKDLGDKIAPHLRDIFRAINGGPWNSPQAIRGSIDARSLKKPAPYNPERASQGRTVTPRSPSLPQNPQPATVTRSSAALAILQQERNSLLQKLDATDSRSAEGSILRERLGEINAQIDKFNNLPGSTLTQVGRKNGAALAILQQERNSLLQKLDATDSRSAEGSILNERLGEINALIDKFAAQENQRRSDGRLPSRNHQIASAADPNSAPAPRDVTPNALDYADSNAFGSAQQKSSSPASPEQTDPHVGKTKKPVFYIVKNGELMPIREDSGEGSPSDSSWRPTPLSLSKESYERTLEQGRVHFTQGVGFMDWAEQVMAGLPSYHADQLGNVWSELTRRHNATPANNLTEAKARLTDFIKGKKELKSQLKSLRRKNNTPDWKFAALHSMLQRISIDSRQIVSVPKADQVDVHVQTGDLPVSMLQTVENGRKVVTTLVSSKLGKFNLDSVVTNEDNKYRPRKYDPPLIYLRRDVDFLTVAHEIIHDIETRHPRIRKAAREFLMKRAAEGDTVPLSEITGKLEDTDLVYLDKWVERGGQRYSGRAYPDGCTEILTTGIERLYSDPARFYEQDPEFFEFVVTTLRGW